MEFKIAKCCEPWHSNNLAGYFPPPHENCLIKSLQDAGILIQSYSQMRFALADWKIIYALSVFADTEF